jgi:hypothetical protein
MASESPSESPLASVDGARKSVPGNVDCEFCKRFPFGKEKITKENEEPIYVVRCIECLSRAASRKRKCLDAPHRGLKCDACNYVRRHVRRHTRR